MAYKVPEQTKIGHVHLKVADLERSLRFYRDILGFEITQWYGNSAVLLSAGGYHHQLGQITWYRKNGLPAPGPSPGHYHLAIVYQSQRDLAVAVKRLMDARYPLTGASDHGVSKAIYLNDPDSNGVELYWDRPASEWPLDDHGNLHMITVPLNMEDLFAELKDHSPE